MRNIFLIIVFTIAAVSCRTARSANKSVIPVSIAGDSGVVVTTVASDTSDVIGKTVSQLEQKRIEFKTFSAKLDVEIENAKGKQPNLNVSLRMIKDSAMWISISATFLNVEVYRIYIDRDSIILLNKQNKEVAYKSIDYLEELSGLPLSFSVLQDLLIGNPVYFNYNAKALGYYENYILITSVNEVFKNILTLKKENLDLLHSKLEDADVTSKRSAELSYADYRNSNGINFATIREILATDKTKLTASLNFKQFEFNKELSVNFSVPKNYLRK